ncbi:MAG: hypothetical protein A2283_08415 [Lentisphaerae bacterium RIFOXYA12_FULL_48_11]|nr:MAG: hypothetical protein A2283_08415 [Lentisphaerae bacterium RIFOXYA12_FULL_48_11]
MNIWTNEALKIIKLLLGNSGQASDIEIAVCLAAAIFSAMIVLRWIGKAFGATMADNGRALTVVGTGLLLALAAVIAFNIYLAPTIKNALLIKWAPIASSSIILIAIVAPMTCLLLKMKYFPAIFASLLSIGAAAGIVILVHGGFGAIKEGDKGFKKTKERTETVNDLITK